MKKISLICGMLLALASSVYAYDNDYTHKISTETATEICGEKFSTTYFDEQYEKLALLKRCELSLKTVPLEIWNLDKYEEAMKEDSFEEAE